ncbi:MAG: hypothetical protein K0R57_4628 [Paenibacillaceae bacterium]|nr:hypothetical protein [Paenibacillaceae bacterium]
MYDIFSFLHHDGFAGDSMDSHDGMDQQDTGLDIFNPHHALGQLESQYDDIPEQHGEHVGPVQEAAAGGGSSEPLSQVLIGDPVSDMPHIEMQEGMNSCAIASQKGVIESITGREIPEIELSYHAYRNGWYDPAAGTAPEHVGKLIEDCGIPVDRGYDWSAADLADALDRGEKVIVGLNSNEIWHAQYDANGNPTELPNAGHAVWVTGMYQDDSGNWFVIMNDSGVPDGAGETVPLHDFLNAWEDYGNFAVITKTGGGTEAVAVAEAGSGVSFGGYYNNDGTYHWSSDNSNTDEKGNILYYD